MSNIDVLAWLTPKATAKADTSQYPILTFSPEGTYAGGEVRLAIRPSMPPAERLAIAERFLTAAQSWRDRIAEDIEIKRTVGDELVAARARIAELEQGADGSDS